MLQHTSNNSYSWCAIFGWRDERISKCLMNAYTCYIPLGIGTNYNFYITKKQYSDENENHNEIST